METTVNTSTNPIDLITRFVVRKYVGKWYRQWQPFINEKIGLLIKTGKKTESARDDKIIFIAGVSKENSKVILSFWVTWNEWTDFHRVYIGISNTENDHRELKDIEAWYNTLFSFDIVFKYKCGSQPVFKVVIPNTAKNSKPEKKMLWIDFGGSELLNWKKRNPAIAHTGELLYKNLGLAV